VSVAAKFPSRKNLFFFLSTLRAVFVILLYTMTSWLLNMNHQKDPKFKILGTVPRGEYLVKIHYGARAYLLTLRWDSKMPRGSADQLYYY
jgi:hypothetical protein